MIFVAKSLDGTLGIKELIKDTKAKMMFALGQCIWDDEYELVRINIMDMCHRSFHSTVH